MKPTLLLRRAALLGVLLALSPLPMACATAANTELVQRDDVREFAREVSQRNGLDQGEVLAILAQAQIQESIIAAMDRPAESKAWYQYRPIFVNEKRIADGAAFMREHAAKLSELEQKYGVPSEILVAIVGVETGYGRNVGKYSVLDALVTLSFEYPRRAPFFRKELEQFILLARDENVSVSNAKGSYAGAMGLPQFMPSSYRQWAVDGDGDSKRDLWGSTDDVLASVANYFVEHGWQRGGSVIVPLSMPESLLETPGRFEAMLNRGRDLAAKTTLGELRALGVGVPIAQGRDDLPIMLIPLQEEDDLRYMGGLPNFFVITRYNHSAHYALAVWELAQAIRQRSQNQGSKSAS
ncbi:MAG: lytic murein transglycosylase B [Pseudomonadota bacterium]